MTVKILAALRTAMGQEIIDALGNGAKIKFYSGTQPAGPATAISDQTLLGTLTGGSPFGAVSNGVVTAGTITQDSAADATDTAAWARLTDASDDAQIDLTVSDNDGDGEIKLNTTAIVAGGPIQVSSLSFTVGGG